MYNCLWRHAKGQGMNVWILTASQGIKSFSLPNQISYILHSFGSSIWAKLHDDIPGFGFDREALA